jgi:RNA polymerase subunit RPABC4/transcription elongation factor Spt4
MMSDCVHYEATRACVDSMGTAVQCPVRNLPDHRQKWESLVTITEAPACMSSNQKGASRILRYFVVFFSF